MNGTNTGKASISVVQEENAGVKGNALITISTRDFEIEGKITLQDGILTWGEIEDNVPRIKGIPTSLILKSGEKKDFNATLKGITGTINWKVEEGSAKFILADESKATETTGENVKLEILDIANNNETVIITAKVEDKCTATCEITVEKILRAKDVLIPNPSGTTEAEKSPYVYYTMNGQTEPTLCRVLYNEGTPEDNGYGIQIITVGTVGSVALGLDDENVDGTYLAKVKKSYNNSVANLNKKAYDLRNSNLSDYARCVGCYPMGIPIINPNEDTTGNITLSGSNASITDLKMPDENYEYDISRMNSLGIAGAGNTYWFASRYCKNDGSSGNKIGLWFGSSVALNEGNGLGRINVGYYVNCYSITLYFRPIFYINPNIKIDSGSGTSADPYILKAGN